MTEIIQPGKAVLIECTISGVPFNDGEKNYFHVQELRIFEDHCKAYFTAQLVIEAHQNVWENFISPGADVTISFQAPRSDGIPTQPYTENFKIFSYESKHREGDIQNAMVITLSLIGEEYYRDRHNTVMMPFSNVPGTAAAATIHEMYMAVNGGLNILDSSMGPIGSTQVPHEVRNLKPIKAIHDLLDKSVFAAYPSCAPMYFRNKPGYEMGPLQGYLETAALTETFIHKPGQAAELVDTLVGYNRIIHLRPMAPPGEQTAGGGQSANMMDGLFKSLSFFDISQGDLLNNDAFSSLGNIAGLANQFKSGVVSKQGGRQLFSVLDSLHQALPIQKNGPGGFAQNEDAFLTALSYTPKFWVSAPLQTGVNVTCGKRINVLYPFSGTQLIAKTLYVARLIHELKFTEGRDREPVNINGTTQMFGVHWQ